MQPPAATQHVSLWDVDTVTVRGCVTAGINQNASKFPNCKLFVTFDAGCVTGSVLSNSRATNEDYTDRPMWPPHVLSLTGGLLPGWSTQGSSPGGIDTICPNNVSAWLL